MWDNRDDTGRGCRQGDPVACYCFILCAEILAIRLRTNDNIHGIKIGDKEVLISQYADDTCLVLDGSRKSIESSLNELKLFADISGLRINFSKSQVVWIGSKKYSNVILGDGYGLQWGNTKFNYLGIEYDVDLNNIIKLNYDKKLVKIKNIVKSWRRRILTPLGKITVIKTLLTSQLNHLFMSIPNPNELFIKKLNTLLFKYIWDEKPDKIKRDILYQPYDKGGLNMIDIKNFMFALKSSWIRRLYKDNKKWKIIIESKIDIHKLANCGEQYIELCYNNITNLFWKDVLLAMKTVVKEQNSFNIFDMPLWYNNRITINKKHVFYENWYKQGIFYVSDLIDHNKEFLSYERFQRCANLRANFLQFHGLISAIKALQRKQYIPEIHIKTNYPQIPPNIRTFLTKAKGTQPMYKILSTKNMIPSSQGKWQNKFNIQLHDKVWQSIYCNPFTITRDTKLQWFQFRINHRILPTNSLLAKIGITGNSLCTFCKDEEESLEHLFWYCHKTQALLNEFKQKLETNHIPVILEPVSFILGVVENTKTKSVDNFILLNIKRFIYNCRCHEKPLNIVGLINYLNSTYKVCQCTATYESKKVEFDQNWMNWKNIFL